MHVRIVQGVALFSILLAACTGDGGGPTAVNPRDLVIAVQGGDKQIGTTGSTLPKPLQVVVSNGATKAPAKGITVTWTATGGGTVSPTTSVTDSTGVASTTLTLPASAGSVTVSATFTGNTGPTAGFSAEATTGATITSLAPTSARAGDTVTVTGTGFSTIAQNNVVLFDGVRGAVASASATQLRVVVPLCLPTRTVQVTVVLGPTTSGALPLSVTGVTGGGLNLAVGQVSLITDATAAGCITLPAGGNYLVAVENATTVTGTSMDFQLLGLGPGGASGSVVSVQARLAQAAGESADAQTQADQHLRQVEAQLQPQGGGTAPAVRGDVTPAAAVPAVGDTGTFKVLNSLTVNTFSTVKAVVKLVTTHAIIYQDVNAPSGGFTSTNFQQFGALYDDPIYPTDTSVYGAPSDIDNNGHVVILFTPVVNSLTAKGASSFVAGFFFGCDLMPRGNGGGQCSGSNQAEIFYASVPDPSGSVGPTLSVNRILQTTPPVLAHEFTHMIAWNQRVILRNGSPDALWLDEALAHTAEDTVGGVFLSRGDSTNAILFESENWRRANDYLPVTASTTLLASVDVGTLAERGAGWLFLKYLRGRFGGGILTKITQTTLSSTDNVTAAAGLGWSILFSDWALALWADNAPELVSASVDPRYTFPNINLRSTLGQPAFGGVYLLQPTTEPFSGFSASGTVLSSTTAYFMVTGTASSAPVSISLSAPRGLPFSGNVVPQIGIMRVK